MFGPEGINVREYLLSHPITVKILRAHDNGVTRSLLFLYEIKRIPALRDRETTHQDRVLLLGQRVYSQVKNMNHPGDHGRALVDHLETVPRSSHDQIIEERPRSAVQSRKSILHWFRFLVILVNKRDLGLYLFLTSGKTVQQHRVATITTSFQYILPLPVLVTDIHGENITVIG